MQTTPVTSKYRILYFCLSYIAIFGTLAYLGYVVSRKSDIEVGHDVSVHRFATDLTFYDLPRMTVEMGSGSAAKTVRIDISIEVAKKDLTIVQGYQPRITASLNVFFIDLDPDRVLKASALPWLHQEMLKQINAAGSPAPVHDVFLRQMLIM